MTHINYVEFPASDLAATKAFFSAAFNWQFTDYGPNYSSFDEQGIGGGFFRAPLCSTTNTGGALIVLLSNDLDASLQAVEQAGGVIIKEIFEFPGGKRFQFTEPSGNELAVWQVD